MAHSVESSIRTKNFNNPVNPIILNISLIFTLCHASLIVHLNLSTAVTNFAYCILERTDSQAQGLTFLNGVGAL